MVSFPAFQESTRLRRSFADWDGYRIALDHQRQASRIFKHRAIGLGERCWKVDDDIIRDFRRERENAGRIAGIERGGILLTSRGKQHLQPWGILNRPQAGFQFTEWDSFRSIRRGNKIANVAHRAMGLEVERQRSQFRVQFH